MTPDDLLAQKESERSARLDPLDFPGTWTHRQRDDYTAGTAALDAEIALLRATINTFASASWTVECKMRLIEGKKQWRDGFLIPARAKLCEKLLTLPQFGRNREELHEQILLETSIDSIDQGLRSLYGAQAYTLKSLPLADLMIEAGHAPDLNNEQLQRFSGLPWQGSLPEVETDLKQLQRELDAAKYALVIARNNLDALVPTNIGA